MPTHINSGTVLGLDGVIVEAETDITSGLPKVIVVGLPDTAVQEARERVKSAIKNTGFKFPQGRIAVNLAPANLPKSGSLYDLPIAVSILAEAGLIEVKAEVKKKSLFIGELALDGRIRPVNGILPIAITAHKKGFKYIFVPKENAKEASLVKQINVIPASSLAEVVNHLEDRVTIKPFAYTEKDKEGVHTQANVDFSDVAGQELAKRALTIAASGHHNILFTGPPGSGKTMLAKALQGILPPLAHKEFIDVTKIYSIAGLLNNKNGIILDRPFRSPHHTSSRIALIGGGSHPKPGEITLAHRGILFLDEFPEFPRSSLESLRQPLEDGVVTVSRASGTFRFPAEFVLVAAQNPCPCGNLGSPVKSCQCSAGQIRRYKTRISGPIMDRIDLVAEVPRQSYKKLKQTGGETSSQVREKVIKAKQIQFKRFESGKTNSRMTPAEIKKHCQLDEKTESMLAIAIDKLKLSARAYHRILKVSRTIADLEDSLNIKQDHISEALQYRWKEEMM